ncbi:MAG TPA: hypothetical protein VER76_16785 [Pyrinomonadaceae bacterium]|nr:hypothetical protein [Pyrinomonadaceae bacterium]
MSIREDESVVETTAQRDDEVKRLVREFEACTLAGERWTHEAHLTVALWYLVRHAGAEATRLIREGIQRYNLARGVEMTKDGGYHETITLFYIRVIRRYLNGTDAEDAATLAELLDGLIAACGDRNFPFEYYSRERLLSWEARTGWLEPDLKSLD